MASDDDKGTHAGEKSEEGHDEAKRDDALADAPPATAKKKGGSKGFILLLAAAAVVALFVTSRRDKGAANNAPPAPPPGWAVGQTIDLELTLVPNDKRDLACAYKDTVAGKHCEFETGKQPWKGGAGDDKALLRPYMTTSQQPLMAAGVWSQLPAPLPTDRFTVKCKYAIDGKLSKPQVRWHDDGVFYDEQTDWFSGSVSGCAIQK